MATADIVILIVILLSSVIGLVRGLVKEVLSLASWVIAFVVAALFAQDLAVYLEPQFANPSLRIGVAFGVVFVAALIAAGIIQWLIGKLVQGTGLSGTDRLLGFLFGSARGVLVCIVALIAGRSFAQDTAWWDASVFIPELLAFEQNVLDLLGMARGALSGLPGVPGV